MVRGSANQLFIRLHNSGDSAGTAMAKDLEALGEHVIQQVKATQGVDLHWEIKRIGIEG
jgi:hypothetical protein